jgi:hypothetical protein
LLDGTYDAPLELEPESLPMFGQFPLLCGAVVLGMVVLGVVVLGVVVVPLPEAA